MRLLTSATMANPTRLVVRTLNNLSKRCFARVSAQATEIETAGLEPTTHD